MLSATSIFLILIAVRNFIRLSNKSIPLNNIEKSVKSLLSKVRYPTTLGYFSNTFEDGLYFNSQFVVAPHVLVKFGKQDTALFIIDKTKSDTLFNLHKMDYKIIDSAQSSNIKSYLLIRK
jgi:hypothetical protein